MSRLRKRSVRNQLRLPRVQKEEEPQRACLALQSQALEGLQPTSSTCDGKAPACTPAPDLQLLHLRLWERISWTENGNHKHQTGVICPWMRATVSQPFQVLQMHNLRSEGVSQKEQEFFPPTTQGQNWTSVSNVMVGTLLLLGFYEE